MVIGVPKEIKNNEFRVGITPAGVFDLEKRGHEVLIQTYAGHDSGFTDDDYRAVGAEIVSTIEEVYARAEMIVKVKEPLPSEYPLIRRGQILFTFFHFAASEPLTKAMVDSGSICIAYETVELADRSLPLLTPMSEVAGRLATQEGAKYLEKPMGGKGILLGGVPGVLPADVIIIGGGVVGTQAAKMASGLSARVTILDINLEKLRELEEQLPDNVDTLFSTEYNLRQLLPTADLIIGAVLIPGAKAPNLITREMLKIIPDGSVVIDVAVDQGGCIETCKPTTHENPTFVVDGVVHYCVANMPGAVPQTSTPALTNATIPYVIQLADKGWKNAVNSNPALRKGMNIVDGRIVYKPVADAFDLVHHDWK